MTDFLINFGKDPGGLNVDKVQWIIARIDVFVYPKMVISEPFLDPVWDDVGTMLPLLVFKRCLQKMSRKK